MMRRVLGLGLFSALLLSSCSSSTTPTTSLVASGVGGAIVSVKNQITAANLVGYTATHSAAKNENGSRPFNTHSAGALTQTDWTTINSDIMNLFCDQGCGTESNNSSPELWVQNMLSPTFQNFGSSTVGLMGRFTNAVEQACVLGEVMGESMPAAGTQNVTITATSLAAANSACGTSMSIPSLPASVTLTITDTSTTGTGLFSREIVASTGGQAQAPFFVYNDGTTARVMVTNNYTPSDGTNNYTYESRYIAELDSATNVARFEGYEHGFPVEDGSGTGFYFYRVYANTSTKAVSVFGQNGGTNCSVSNGGSTVCPTADLVLQENTMMGLLGTVGVNDATVEVLASNAGTPTWDEIGCVNMTTGNVDSGAACTGQTLDLNTSAFALVNTTVLAVTQSSLNLTATVAELGFDGTTIFSAAPTN